MIRRLFTPGLLVLAAAFALMISDSARAQTARAQIDPSQISDPVFRDYKGITIGLTASDVHQKLGAPKEGGAEQDFYTLSDKEAVQVFYDKTQKVKAICVSYLGVSGAPDARSVLGADVAPAADGSVYTLVRYPQAGYWVSYNRTGGDDPLVTVTIQKITATTPQ